MALTKIVRSEKAPRTSEYASNPERKNTPCISDLAGGMHFENGKGVFFGVLPSMTRAVGGANTELGKAEIYFLGIRIFRFASADFPPAERGLGNECGRDSL